MIKKIMLILILSLFITNAKAQYDIEKNRIGFRGSFGMSSITGLGRVNEIGLPNVNYEIGNFKSSPRISWDLGISYQYTNESRTFIQANLLLNFFTGSSLSGVSKKYDDDITSINISSISIETHLGKKIRFKDDQHFVLGCGPYIAFQYSSGYGGSADLVYNDVCYEDEEGEYCVEESSFVGGEEPRQRVFGAGVEMFVGFEFGSNQIVLSGTQGLTKVFKDGRYNSKLRTLKLSYSFFFNL